MARKAAKKSAKKKAKKGRSREPRAATRRAVLIEAGYRCAVPTCRMPLTIDMHHIVAVEEDGPDSEDNLLALCANCHDLIHREKVPRDAIYTYKAILLSLSRAFDLAAVDKLLWLRDRGDKGSGMLSGDGVLANAGLIVSGLVETFSAPEVHHSTSGYQTVREGLGIRLTRKGRILVDAWKSGDREALKSVLGVIPPASE